MTRSPKTPTSPGLPRGFSFDGGVPDGALFVRPIGLLAGHDAVAALRGGSALALNRGWAFPHCEVLCFGRDGLFSAAMPAAELAGWAERSSDTVAEAVADTVARLAAPVPDFAGIGFDSPRLMGIVNVTPDSFSDGVDRSDPAKAVGLGLALIESGADIVDVGGESTRPGAVEVPADIELRRVIPVIDALARHGPPVSIDTRHAAVMREALAAGAKIINDVSALTHDDAALGVAAGAAVPVVLMDDRRLKATDHAPAEVVRYLHRRVAACAAAGIERSRIAVDPGIGFGKSPAQNLRILADIALLHGLGCAVVQGTSRKLGRPAPPGERLGASLAATVHGLSQAVQIHRVHDVAENRQAARLWAALREG